MRDRRLTVSYSYQRPLLDRRYGDPDGKVPYLRLRGEWLRRAGFTIGDRVRVEVEAGRLVVVSER